MCVCVCCVHTCLSLLSVNLPKWVSDQIRSGGAIKGNALLNMEESSAGSNTSCFRITALGLHGAHFCSAARPAELMDMTVPINPETR